MNPEIASRFADYLAGYFFSRFIDGAVGYLGPRLFPRPPTPLPIKPGVLLPPLGPVPTFPVTPHGGDIYPSYSDPWRGAGATPTRRDPLVLDLNRDGKVELKNAAFFDLNANGFHEFTRWIDKTDAFLVLDKNFNGKADNGSELFGDVMTLPDGSLALTGFDALRAYDSNGDGKIGASDESYWTLPWPAWPLIRRTRTRSSTSLRLRLPQTRTR